MKKIACIYAITNLVDGKRYIGSTTDFKRRATAHASLLGRGKHHSLHLQRAWNKYGKNSFVFGILSKISLDSDLVQSEQAWLDSYLPEYNILPTANSFLGFRHSEETKGKISRSTTGIKKSPESVKKSVESRKGIKISESTRKKMSISHMGYKPSEKSIQKMQEAQKRIGRSLARRKQCSGIAKIRWAKAKNVKLSK